MCKNIFFECQHVSRSIIRQSINSKFVKNSSPENNFLSNIKCHDFDKIMKALTFRKCRNMILNNIFNILPGKIFFSLNTSLYHTNTNIDGFKINYFALFIIWNAIYP